MFLSFVSKTYSRESHHENQRHQTRTNDQTEMTNILATTEGLTTFRQVEEKLGLTLSNDQSFFTKWMDEQPGGLTESTNNLQVEKLWNNEMPNVRVFCFPVAAANFTVVANGMRFPNEDIKLRFRDGEIKLLLCTESASEGLNLQTCGVLFNYDMPWNPMRVEQRIGRIDRIGQKYSTVRIHNFYYDGTVEAKVYKKLRDAPRGLAQRARINAFATVIGNLQPILAKVPTFLERAVMSADPQEEDVLLSEFDHDLDIPPLRPALDEMVTMDVEADLAELRKPIPQSPISQEVIEQLFTISMRLRVIGATFERTGEQWSLTYKNQHYAVTFYPDLFDQHPSLRLIDRGSNERPSLTGLESVAATACRLLESVSIQA